MTAPITPRHARQTHNEVVLAEFLPGHILFRTPI
jgi:hypothetical protein